MHGHPGNQNRIKLYLAMIACVAVLLRVAYSSDLPLNGDECVSLLLANGHALDVTELLPEGNEPRARILEFLERSRDWSPWDIVLYLHNYGMHPPFYFLLLHYVTALVGNGAFALRMVSVAFSSLSVLLIYGVGRKVYGEKTGLLAALMFAVSLYGLRYGLLLRPYPLAMFLSLASTILMFNMYKDGKEEVNPKALVPYTLTVLLGLYSIYHFLFVFIFQLAYMALSSAGNRKGLLLTASVATTVFLLYLPWIPSFLNQLSDVRGGHYYFHGIQFPFNMYLITTVIIIGYLLARRDAKTRTFCMATIICLLSNLTADIVMGAHTLHVGNLLYFLAPVSFLYISIIISRLSADYRFLKKALPVLFCLIILGNTLLNFKKNRLPSEEYLDLFPAEIGDRLEGGGKGLIIFNTRARRYVFPLLHATNLPVDAKIIKTGGLKAEMDKISGIRDYDLIFLVNLHASHDMESYLSETGIGFVSGYLSANGFRPEDRITAPSLKKNALLVYAKGDGPV
jgi:uncharacterized membrane protein